MKNNVEERIKIVLSSVFNISKDQINKNSSPDTIESWDSLKHMNLIVALEEEFDFSLNDQQIFEMVNFDHIKKTVFQLYRERK